MEIQQQINLLIKYEIDERQLLFLNILYNFSINEKLNNIDTLINHLGVSSLQGNRKVLSSLQQRNDLIEKGLLRANTITNSYSLTDLFISELENKRELIQDIWDIYPDFGLIKGVKIPLKNANKEEVGKIYLKNIKSSRKEHLEVIKDIQYTNVNEPIVLNIKNFIVSELYLSYRKQREDKPTTNILVNDEDL